MGSKIKEFTKKNPSWVMYIVLVVLFAVFAVMSPAFLKISNLINVLRQVAMLGIASIGMTFVLLLGGIDLSIGSQMSVVAVLGGTMMTAWGLHPWISCILCIVFTSLVGFFNGIVIAKVKMPPLIVTLCSMTVLEGLAYKISGGIPVFGFPEGFSVLGQGYVGPIPIPVIIMVIVMAIGSVILNKSYFGRFFYAVGGNEEASHLSGIDVTKIKCLVYTLSGTFAGLAGCVLLSRTNSGQPTAGKGFEFDVLTAIVLGGVSVNGGAGKISNVVAGVLIMGVLENGMVLVGASTYDQMIIKGIVLLLAVGFDFIQRARSKN